MKMNRNYVSLQSEETRSTPSETRFSLSLFGEFTFQLFQTHRANRRRWHPRSMTNILRPALERTVGVRWCASELWRLDASRSEQFLQRTLNGARQVGTSTERWRTAEVLWAAFSRIRNLEWRQIEVTKILQHCEALRILLIVRRD